MTDLSTLATARFCAETHCFAAGAAVELAGQPWEITRKSAHRKRQIITVGYTLRLLRPIRLAALVNAGLRPGQTLVATQQPPRAPLSAPLTVASVDIVEDAATCACQVKITAVTCFFGGSFHAPMPEADTDMTIKILTTNPQT